MNNRGQTKLLVGLIILIILGALGYLGYMLITDHYEKKIDESYNQGALEMGVYIMSEAMKCSPLPISWGNYSINLIATECLQ